MLVVDDAHECLEAATIAALTPHTQHIILVGDPARSQLNPRAAVGRLSKHFRLPTSLFARLLASGVEATHLSTQHRMLPHLSRVLRPLRPAWRDAAHLEGAEGSIVGVEHALFMLRHSKPETLEPTSRSRCNPHEAAFCAAFAVYLVRQGYAPSTVAILTPFCGQVLAISRELRALGTAELDGLRVSTFDAFGTSEALIVILSLVHSPAGTPAATTAASTAEGAKGAMLASVASRGIGVVGAEQRIALALSRARLGLFLIGNADALGADAKPWELVLRQLHEVGAIGTFLPLLATRTKTGKRALVRSGDDFDGVVGEKEALALS